MKRIRMSLAKVGSLRQADKVILVLAALFLLVSVALAQSGNGYDLTWNTVDGGGATFSTGGDYSLGGTIGQPDAGMLSNGDYTLAGGFWRKVVVPISYWYKIYLPLIFKNW